ncbi:HWE histidine kinase domain-containing protein [Phenylobacterium sp.]|uniref:sensor histidine kinase n=1 Tax=Phenylobacterium sp. TaxID=1871053 RepID=UPI0025DD1F6D|nr:HWE histidine kinase domain-containing protein [Phenylobacterium sp.]MBX3482609.1 PAS domain-containing protein [Phenylobacterium sp.]
MRKTPSPPPGPEDRLSAVLDGISDVYYAIDRDWRFWVFNRAAEEFFGFKRGEMLGKSFHEIYPQGAGTPFVVMLEQAMDKGEPGRLTAPSALRQGRTVDIRVSALGELGVGVAIDDVTERAAAERAVRESERRLDLAVGAHKVGISDWHVASGKAVWNAEMEDIFGIPRGSFEGHTEHFRRRVVPEDLERMESETAAALAAGKDVVAYEFRLVRPDGEIRWIEGAARFVFDADGQPRRMVGANVDITERRKAETHQRLLINELNHRVKNTLAIVQGIAWQSFRAAGAPKSATEAFEGRLRALASAHDVLTRQNWEAGPIGQIIAEAVAPHHDGRIVAAGPAVDLDPKAAVAVGLAMHELATNAVKYGALSSPAGRVDVSWTVEAGKLRLTWRESGGPPVKKPAQRGFGARLLEQGLAEELRGSVRLSFPPEGLVCEVEARLG